MAEPRDQPAPEPDGDTDEPPCPCGSDDHQPVRIGERLTASGAHGETVYVCPAESATGLSGVL